MPGGVEADVETVIVDEAVGVNGFGLNEQEGPDGETEAESVTEELKPF